MYYVGKKLIQRILAKEDENLLYMFTNYITTRSGKLGA